MCEENERTLIDEFEKNSAETVRTFIREYQGRLCVDFRAWTAGDLGEKIPTKKGLMISVEILPDLLKAVQLAIMHIRDGEKAADSGMVQDFPE